MKWGETVASDCRYGSNATAIFGDADIIWERSEAGYQGHANVLARLPDGRFCHYEWSYGSCSGCDEWESRDLTGEEIEAEMWRGAVFFDSVEEVRRYLKLEGEYEHATVPTANAPDNGGLYGMLRTLSGDAGEEFLAMRAAFAVWEQGGDV